MNMLTKYDQGYAWIYLFLHFRPKTRNLQRFLCPEYDFERMFHTFAERGEGGGVVGPQSPRRLIEFIFLLFQISSFFYIGLYHHKYY